MPGTELVLDKCPQSTEREGSLLSSRNIPEQAHCSPFRDISIRHHFLWEAQTALVPPRAPARLGTVLRGQGQVLSQTLRSAPPPRPRGPTSHRKRLTICAESTGQPPLRASYLPRQSGDTHALDTRAASNPNSDPDQLGRASKSLSLPEPYLPLIKIPIYLPDFS